MWESILLDEAIDRGYNVVVPGDVVECVWSVLFDPERSAETQRYHGTPYHGKLSSASTGRSAAIRLPLAAVLSELNCIEASLAGGASTSISSS